MSKKRKDKQVTKALWIKKLTRAFSVYAAAVLVLALGITAPTLAFAAGDPLSVVNNLSDFIFGFIRAIGLILLGFGIV